MAYGSTLTDLQTGVNNEAAIQASRDASQRDYYARLAEMRRLRDAQNQNNAYQNRALDTNARLQGRQIDNTGAYQTGTLALGGRELDVKTANALAEIALSQKRLDQQAEQFSKELEARTQMNKENLANVLEAAKIGSMAGSPQATVARTQANDLASEWNATAESVASQANYKLDLAKKRKETAVLNGAEVFSPSTWLDPQKAADAQFSKDVADVMTSLGVHADKVKWDGTKFVPAKRDYIGSPVPTVTPVNGTGTNGAPPGSPIPPSVDSSAAPAIRSMPDISSWSVTGSGGGSQAPATYSAPVTQIPSAPVTVVPRTAGISGMGGTFGGGPSPLVQDPVLVKNTILARQMDAWLASFPPDKQPSLAEKRAHARLLNSQYQSQ